MITEADVADLLRAERRASDRLALEHQLGAGQASLRSATFELAAARNATDAGLAVFVAAVERLARAAKATATARRRA